MRKLATIRQIKEIVEIPKANNIELVLIDGWQCVAKKGEFSVNDLCVFFEIDSRLPQHKVFEFMQSRKFKVKTIKCMKQISQGLALPVSILKEFSNKSFKLGDDVTDVIGVKHIDSDDYQKSQSNKKSSWIRKILLRYKFTRKILQRLEKKSTFPTHIVKKTDEERIQNLTTSIHKFSNKEFDVTEKIDGCSATYIYRPNYLFEEFLVCSRNQLLNKSDNSYWWTVARQEDIKKELKNLHKINNLGRKEYIVIQGEIIGEGIQKNKYKITGYEFYIFNMILGKKRLNYHETSKVINNANSNLKQVSYRGNFIGFSCDDFMRKVKHLGESKSLHNPKIYAEGVVCRSGDISFKYINPKFLLKFEE